MHVWATPLTAELGQISLTVTDHDVGFPFGVAQIGIQPVHERLDLHPVQEDDKNQEEEVQHTQSCTTTQTHTLQKRETAQPTNPSTQRRPFIIYSCLKIISQCICITRRTLTEHDTPYCWMGSCERTWNKAKRVISRHHRQ